MRIIWKWCASLADIQIEDVVIPFSLGILFAPWNNSGFALLLAYLLCIEAIVCVRCKSHIIAHYMRRGFIFFSGIIGWLLGRIAFQHVNSDESLAEKSGLSAMSSSIGRFHALS